MGTPVGRVANWNSRPVARKAGLHGRSNWWAESRGTVSLLIAGAGSAPRLYFVQSRTFAAVKFRRRTVPSRTRHDFALRQRLLEFLDPRVRRLRAVQVERGEVFERCEFLESRVRHLRAAQIE